MSVVITEPPHSFIGFGDNDVPGDCAPAIPICMPMYQFSDVGFQLIVTVDGTDKDWFNVEQEGEEEEDPNTLTTIQGKFCFDCEADPAFSATAFTFNATWTLLSEGTEDVWLGYFQPIQQGVFNQIDIGQCFNICFYRVEIDPENPGTVINVNTTLIACTATCFQKIADPCFTTLFVYRNNESAFGFLYGSAYGNPNNAVRLPCYLRDTQFPSEEKSYQKSDGSYIKLFERIDVEYELVVDFIPSSGHRKLKILLAHDIITVSNVDINAAQSFPVVCREKYEISWPAHPWQHAPAKTRLRRADALHLLNSNCQ